MAISSSEIWINQLRFKDNSWKRSQFQHQSIGPPEEVQKLLKLLKNKAYISKWRWITF